jgi:hypothetical protein
MKYIYLIQSQEEGYYKIGISKNPQKRIKQLQTGNSSPLKLIETYKTEYAEKIEGTLHRRYSHYHKTGEWFDMSVAEEASFLRECKKLEETFKFLEKNSVEFL